MCIEDYKWCVCVPVPDAIQIVVFLQIFEAILHILFRFYVLSLVSAILAVFVAVLLCKKLRAGQRYKQFIFAIYTISLFSLIGFLIYYSFTVFYYDNIPRNLCEDGRDKRTGKTIVEYTTYDSFHECITMLKLQYIWVIGGSGVIGVSLKLIGIDILYHNMRGPTIIDLPLQDNSIKKSSPAFLKL